MVIQVCDRLRTTLRSASFGQAPCEIGQIARLTRGVRPIMLLLQPEHDRYLCGARNWFTALVGRNEAPFLHRSHSGVVETCGAAAFIDADSERCAIGRNADTNQDAPLYAASPRTFRISWWAVARHTLNWTRRD
jgi:hypothetical protein